MCLIAWRIAPSSRYPLVLAANRDEFHARAATPLHRWAGAHDDPASVILAGRDAQAGGTWLGVSVRERAVRVGALTNIRARPPRAGGAASRGTLVTGWLQSDDPPLAHLQRLRGGTATTLAGFNLVAMTLGFGERPKGSCTVEAAHLHNLDTPRIGTIGEGIGSVSNATLGVRWPKTVTLEASLRAACHLVDSAPPAGTNALRTALFDALADRRPAPEDRLPHTGLDPARERLLSSVFIADEIYGTRCSTVVVVSAEGLVEIVERTFGPAGAPAGEEGLRYEVCGGVRS